MTLRANGTRATSAYSSRQRRSEEPSHPVGDGGRYPSEPHHAGGRTQRARPREEADEDADTEEHEAGQRRREQHGRGPAQEKEWQDRHHGADGEHKERGNRRLDRRAEVLGVEAK